MENGKWKKENTNRKKMNRTSGESKTKTSSCTSKNNINVCNQMQTTG